MMILYDGISMPGLLSRYLSGDRMRAMEIVKTMKRLMIKREDDKNIFKDEPSQ